MLVWHDVAGRGNAWFTWTEADTRRALESELALAQGEGFYAVVLPGRGEIQLRSRGALLETYPLVRCQVARPRTFFVPGAIPGEWKGTAWSEGNLEPARVARRSLPAGEDETVIPPLPEEAFPAPGRWTVRFREGVVLQVVGVDAEGRERAGSGPWTLPAGTLGLRVTLSAADADRLYRGLPQRLSLIVRG